MEGYVGNVQCTAQSRQSVKLFIKSSEFGLPQPLTRRRVCPPPPGSGGRGTFAGERGVETWKSPNPIPTRGHTLWYSLYCICVLCGVQYVDYIEPKIQLYIPKWEPDI
jgi:hypothetical protein